MGRKLIFLLAIGLIAGAAQVFAQSNQVIDALLEERMTSFGGAAYLLLTATGRISEDASPEQAASALYEQGWSVPLRAAGEPLTVGEYSYLLMQALELDGGVMYRIFPGPRYAARELAYLEVIRGNGSPSRTFDGDEAIGILGRLLDWKEGQS